MKNENQYESNRSRGANGFRKERKRWTLFLFQFF